MSKNLASGRLQIDGRRLRELREKKGLLQSDLGKQSTISRLEKENPTISERDLEDIAGRLSVDPSTLVLRSTNFASLWKDYHGDFLADVDQFITDYGQNLAANADRPDLPDRIRTIDELVQKYTSAHYLAGRSLTAIAGPDGGVLAQLPLATLDQHVASGGTITHIVRRPRGGDLFGNPIMLDDLEHLRFAVKLSVRYHAQRSNEIGGMFEELRKDVDAFMKSRLKKLRPELMSEIEKIAGLTAALPISPSYSYFSLDQSGPVEFDIDVLHLADFDGLIMLPTRKRDGWDEAVRLGEDCQAVTEHLDLVRSFARRGITIFGPNTIDTERFAREWARGARGSYCLFQRLPGEFTRPVTHYQPGTPWWKRMEAHYSNVEALARLRRARYHQVRDDLSKSISLGFNGPQLGSLLTLDRDQARLQDEPHFASRLRQICCREDIDQWAANGSRSDLDRSWGADEPEERIERIREIILLLERYPSFEMAIVSREDIEESAPGLTWSVLDSSRINIERGFKEGDYFWPECNNSKGDRKIRVVLEDPTLGCVFESVFSELWAQVNPYDRARGATILYFRDKLRVLESA